MRSAFVVLHRWFGLFIAVFLFVSGLTGAVIGRAVGATLGQVIARLLGLAEEDCPVRKGAIWWLRQRERGGELQTVLYTVQTPELL